MNNTKKQRSAKRIAIAADNNKRTELIEWSYFNRHILEQHELTAISETAEILEGTLNFPVKKLFTRETGGYQQLAELIESGKIDILFFFAEPAVEKENDNDLKKLLVLAAAHNIMLACNAVTTELIMNSVLKSCLSSFQINNHPGIINRAVNFTRQFAIKTGIAAM